MNQSKTGVVLVFGAFDPLHAGHQDFFRQAAILGESLTVVVTSDEAIRREKRREVHQSESQRAAAIRPLPGVSQVLIGEEKPEEYNLLRELSFDVLALGYDQRPDDETVRTLLASMGKAGVQVVRLSAFRPQEFKSSKLREVGAKAGEKYFDLHLHSTYSDGDETVADLVAAVAKVGLAGFSLTDHNGIWGVAEAGRLATAARLACIQGIEVSARSQEVDIHVLGYARAFDGVTLHQKLANTRAGYAERMRKMVSLCQAAGYTNITWEEVTQQRATQEHPVYVSHDLRRLLREKYQLSFEEVRRLTTRGGVCHVPYGDWALSGPQAIELIHQAGGVAVLAHPGTTVADVDQAKLEQIVSELSEAGLDGLEIYHPFHTEELAAWLAEYAHAHSLLVTGGSDWHGASQFPESHAQFGAIGATAAEFEALLSAASA